MATTSVRQTILDKLQMTNAFGLYISTVYKSKLLSVSVLDGTINTIRARVFQQLMSLQFHLYEDSMLLGAQGYPSPGGLLYLRVLNFY